MSEVNKDQNLNPLSGFNSTMIDHLSDLDTVEFRDMAQGIFLWGSSVDVHKALKKLRTARGIKKIHAEYTTDVGSKYHLVVLEDGFRVTHYGDEIVSVGFGDHIQFETWYGENKAKLRDLYTHGLSRRVLDKAINKEIADRVSGKDLEEIIKTPTNELKESYYQSKVFQEDGTQVIYDTD